MAKKDEGKAVNGAGSLEKRLLRDGTVRWRMRVTIGFDGNGKQQQRSVTGDTPQETIAKAHALNAKARSGMLSDAKVRVGDYLSRWLEEKRLTIKPRTHSIYSYILESYVMPHIGWHQLSKLRPQHVQETIAKIAAGKSPDAANKSRRVLYGALQQAVRLQLIPVNPAVAVQPLRHEKRDMVLWTSEQATRFLDTTRPHRLYAAFYLFMSSGLRRGELLGLHWDDLQNGVLHVRRSLGQNGSQTYLSTPKTQKGNRRVPLTVDVLDALEEHRKRQAAERATVGAAYQDDGIMFASMRGTYLNPRNLERTFHVLQRQARAEWLAEAERNDDDEGGSGGVPQGGGGGAPQDGTGGAAQDVARLDKQGKLLPRITLHDLRHLHASIAIRSGTDPKVLADRLGHANASTTLDVYTHLFEEQREQSAVSVAALLAPRGAIN
jgi:integrase